MTAITWTHSPDTGVTYSEDGRFDILESPDGYMLRENRDSVDWVEVDTYDTLTEAQAAAGPRYSLFTESARKAAYSDPDGYDRNGAYDGFQVTSDAEGGL
jgi:hypothetical protein